MLRQGTIVDATIMAAPSSTKNEAGRRDPEIHQTRKGNQWYFGMKANVGVDAESGPVHTMGGTAANASDVTQAYDLLHGEETCAFGDSGYTGVATRPERRCEIDWHVAMKPGKRRKLGKTPPGRLREEIEHPKARLRARGEHAFRMANGSSATSRSATAGWPRTRRNCTCSSAWQTSGWSAASRSKRISLQPTPF